MKKEFLDKHFDKTGEEIFVYFSDKTIHSPALSLLFKSYSDLLEQNLARKKFYWESLDDSVVVWAETKDKRVVSGIVFNFVLNWRAGYILTTFTDIEYRDRGINKLCFKHYLDKTKEQGMVRTMGLAAIDNSYVIKNNEKNEKVSWGGGEPTFIVFMQKL